MEKKITIYVLYLIIVCTDYFISAPNLSILLVPLLERHQMHSVSCKFKESNREDISLVTSVKDWQDLFYFL